MKEDTKNNIVVGWAGRDITPDRPVNLYGQFSSRISESVLDPVTVTALVIGRGDEWPPGAKPVLTG